MNSTPSPKKPRKQLKKISDKKLAANNGLVALEAHKSSTSLTAYEASF